MRENPLLESNPSIITYDESDDRNFQFRYEYKPEVKAPIYILK